MKKRWIRLLFTVVLMAISIAALAWGLLPGAKVVRRQKIEPTEMQLPTPSSVLPPAQYLAGLDTYYEAACGIHGADRFVLLI
ncbi:MAG TPA: hypothetical protein VGK00_13520 [Anaerolineales bacterium]|jgi:hypothetical protein